MEEILSLGYTQKNIIQEYVLTVILIYKVFCDFALDIYWVKTFEFRFSNKEINNGIPFEYCIHS